jgi:hypothetical protein
MDVFPRGICPFHPALNELSPEVCPFPAAENDLPAAENDLPAAKSHLPAPQNAFQAAKIVLTGRKTGWTG